MRKVKIIALLLAIFTIHEIFFVDSFTTYYLLKTEREDGIQLTGASSYQFIGNQVYQKGEGYQQFYDKCSVEDKSNWVCENGGFGFSMVSTLTIGVVQIIPPLVNLDLLGNEGRWARISERAAVHLANNSAVCLIVPGRYQ